MDDLFVPDGKTLPALGHCIAALKEAARTLHDEGLQQSANRFYIIATDADAVFQEEMRKLG